MMSQFIAYIRLSRQKTGETQYGFESQMTIIKNYVKDGEILSIHQEFMSGTNKRKSGSKVYEAIEECKRTGATLIVAKLDRLCRDVSFLQYVLNSGIKFTACDYPGTNRMVLNIMASIGEYEAQLIQSRVKAGLAEAKKAGVILGTPANLSQVHREAGAAAVQEKWKKNSNMRRAIPLIRAMWGKPISEICDQLNSAGYKTAKELKFTPLNVSAIYNRKIAKA